MEGIHVGENARKSVRAAPQIELVPRRRRRDPKPSLCSGASRS